MIRTKDLESFINSCIVNSPDFAREHYYEIIKRLQRYDELLEEKEQKQFYIIVDKKSKLVAGISTGHSPGKRFVFEKKGEADYFSLDWDGDVVKKATLIWDKNRGK